ncbi:MAG: hydroxymethylglutaryl-CoA lyase [Pseudomonadota bacterium]
MAVDVTLVEVGARDGLQNEKGQVSVQTKIELVNRLSGCGFSHVEAGAFVSPKWVPQMASSDEVIKEIERHDGVTYSALVPNMKGYDAALEAKSDVVAVFAAASETFSQKNTNASISDVLTRFEPVFEAAKQDGVKVRAYVSCVLGCPYEGDIDVGAVVSVSTRLHEMGAYEISLGDTIGVGVPARTRTLMKTVASELPVEMIAGHFHDTYGQAIANIYAAMEEGVRTFDASVAGLGGCPYAKGASGNVASEDVVYMLDKSGIKTGVDIGQVIETGRWISKELDRPVGSKLGKI